MKRCPKCNRTFPDENQKFCTVDGGLLIGAPAFDPNATMRATSADLGVHTSDVPRDNAATRSEFPDLNATIAASSVAPTAVFPRNTEAAGAPTSADLPPSRPQWQAAPPVAAPIAQPPKKKSKLPWILGGLLLLLLMGAGGAGSLFFFVIKPKLQELRDGPRVSQTPQVVVGGTNKTSDENTNKNPSPEINKSETKTETDTFVPPADAVKFTNSKANLEGKLAEHYLDFSFYYPKSWQTDAKAGVPGASNFVKVERMLPPDFTQENFAVGWYTSKGTFAADQPTFPELVRILGSNLSKSFPEYRKVSEGPTKVNSLDGYEFRFASLSKGTEKGDIQLWGRVLFLPTGVEGETTGATLIMLSTSLAPELSGVEDVGEKGEMPVILESFRFGRNK
jgi:hypothetical protein